VRLTVFGVNGPYPAPGGACSGYMISSDDQNVHLLLDCGSGVLAKLVEWPTLTKLTAIVLSHLHYDHMSDMLPMRYALEFAGVNLPVYAPKTPAPQAALLSGGRFDLFTIEDTSIGPFRVLFLPARHPVEAYSIAILENKKKFVYTGDTNTNPELSLFADGADVLLADAGLLECDWSERAPHLSARKCGEVALEARAKALVLTHLSPRYDPQQVVDEARLVYPGAVLAQPGMTLSI
jgi:ribonuclease BN (tRNA processing enzyme)